MEFLNVKLFFHNLVRLTKKHVFLGSSFMKFSAHYFYFNAIAFSLDVSHVAVRGTRGTSRAGSGGVRRGSWMAHGSSALGPLGIVSRNWICWLRVRVCCCVLFLVNSVFLLQRFCFFIPDTDFACERIIDLNCETNPALVNTDTDYVWIRNLKERDFITY